MQTVILKREQTAQELAEANAAEAAAAAASGTAQVTMNGSNGHLNTGKFNSLAFPVNYVQSIQFCMHRIRSIALCIYLPLSQQHVHSVPIYVSSSF